MADEVVKREIDKSISPTQVGRFLKRGGFETAQGRYWLNKERHENPELFDQQVKTVCELYEQAPSLHEQGVHV